MKILEKILEETKVEGAISMHSSDLVVLLFKPNRTSDDLEIFASDSEVWKKYNNFDITFSLTGSLFDT